MIRTYKFLMRPTIRQEQALVAMLRDHCSLYNGALEERRNAYRQCGVTVQYGTQSAQLKDIRAFDPQQQGRWSFSSQQATLRRLDKAFAAFFRRIKAGKKPGYPRFKGIGHFDTVDFPRDGDGCRWDSMPHDPATRVRLQGVGHVKVRQHRPVTGKIKTISVRREGRRWYVVLGAERIPEPLPPTGNAVGIDMGIANFLADSDGGFVANPRFGRKAAPKLQAAQRELSRCKRHSKRSRKVVGRIATLHRKVQRQRLDHAHKTALALIREHDFIAHEDLGIQRMSKSPAPRPNEDGTYAPNGAAAKAGLNRSIADAGWGVFLAILSAKAESAGREVMAMDPRNTSRRCPDCGHTAKGNRPSQEKFRCVACGYTAHADTVGALNVLRAGLARREADRLGEKPPRSRDGGVTKKQPATLTPCNSPT